jgi:SAM-dependent methyltransferase
MQGFWTERSLEPERMDLETLDAATAASILRTLETINAWLGGVRATLYHVRQFSKRWNPGERVRFIDWGTGGADLPRALVRWGRKNGFTFEVTGVDSNGPVLDYAREACREYPEIRLVAADFNAFAAAPGSFDYALSSLSLHHMTDPQIVALLQRSDRLARRGLIMNDLKRSVRAWAWIWALSRLGGAHPIVQNDGPLSVRRAFRPRELEHFAEKTGLAYLKVKTHFGYRLTLAGEKSLTHRLRRFPLSHGERATAGDFSPLPSGEGVGVRHA